jgi:ABC-type phosphate/phosphonate transport system substrate-binding protein
MKPRVFLLAILVTASIRAEDDLRLLVMDPLAAKNSCTCVEGHGQRDYDALAGHLGEALKIPVCPQFSAVLIGKPAIIIGKQTEIEHAAKAANLKLTHLAMLTDKTGGTNCHGLFVVRAKDPAKSIADLKGRKVLLGLEGADEKHAAARAALKEAGVKFETRETCNQVAAEIAERNADAGVIADFALALVIGCGTVGKNELRVIGRTADVPFVALYATQHCPAGTIPELRAALDTLAADSHLLEKLESSKGFVAVKKK